MHKIGSSKITRLNRINSRFKKNKYKEILNLRDMIILEMRYEIDEHLLNLFYEQYTWLDEVNPWYKLKLIQGCHWMTIDSQGKGNYYVTDIYLEWEKTYR